MANITPPLRYQGDGEAPVTKFLARSQIFNWQVLIYAIILVLAIFTRFHVLGDRVMSHDESLHTRYSYNLYADGNFQHTPMMHGPILFHAVAFFYFILGDNDFSARVYPAILGVLLVMSPILFRRWIGNWGAIIASVMMLVSPMMMYYNRYIREDTPAIFFTMVMVYTMFMYIDGPENRRRKGYWLYIFSAAMLGNLATKETAFIYIAVFGTFFTLYWAVRLFQHFRRVPSRPLFYLLTVGVLVGMLVALGMYVVLSVAPLERVSSSIEIAGGFFDSMVAVSFVTWTLILILGALVLLLVTGVWSARNGKGRFRLSDILLILAVAIIVCGVLVFIEERSHIPQTEETEIAEIVAWPLVLAWGIATFVVGIVIVSWKRGWWRTLHRFPELDVMIIMATLILPWAAPFTIKLMGANPTDYTVEGTWRAVFALLPMAMVSISVGLAWNWRRWLISAAVFHILFAFFFTTMFTNVNGLATGMIGSLGYWLEQQGVRRGGQPQYYYILLIMPFYEFLPIIGSVLAMFSGLGAFWHYRQPQVSAAQQADLLTDGSEESAIVEPETPKTLGQLQQDRNWLKRPSFLLFVSWWALLNLIGYTLAGEKMPWLATHITYPLMFLAAWYFGRVLERVSWPAFKRVGWIYVLLLLVLGITAAQVIAPFFFTAGPLVGLQQEQLAQTGQWLALVAVTGAVLMGLIQLAERGGWQHLRQMVVVALLVALTVLTTRFAVMATFDNADYATEYLVYAHSAPAVKWVLDDLQELSQRTTDGMALSFAYDELVSWPYSWYFRDFPHAQYFVGSPSRPVIDNAQAILIGEGNRATVEALLDDQFYHREYIRMWWPMQDYYSLTPERVATFWDFSGDNIRSQQLRRGVFDIWWARDYTIYGEAVGRNFDVERWPVANRMHLYIRKDYASQIWNLGVGDGSVVNPLDNIEVNVCNANWEVRSADQVFGMIGTAPGTLNRPLGVAVADDGRILVVEEGNHRVSAFDTVGDFETVLGGTGDIPGIAFSRPSNIAIGPDGNYYIADTWNYQVKVVSPEGNLINSWGERGEYGIAAVREPVYGLWGPRAVAVDASGRVYVADTGNKRIRVYSSTGTHLQDIGSGGAGPGQLDEPAGLAIHPDGRLFVADTWNRRVSVFDAQTGTYLDSFTVRGWIAEQGNRPYLAIDADRDLLYVGDPDVGRVLVYTTQGDCLGSFGQLGGDAPNNQQFSLVGGMDVDTAGNLYIADPASGRILRFPPYQPPVTEEALNGVDEALADFFGEGEVLDDDALFFGEDLFAEMTEETLPESFETELTAEVEAGDP
jgi:uncharacterized protein (TIGR03663 family)